MRGIFGSRAMRPKPVGAAAALAAPAAATVVNELVPNGNEASAAVYMLAVMAAALVGGLAPGILTAFLSAVLEFFFFTTPSRSFALRAVEDLIPLATFLSAAVIVAGLIEKVNGAHREAVDLAQDLQATLLPPALPVIPGLDIGARFVSGTERLDIGGDFFDAFPAGGGRWLAVLGDVQGKGVPAATVAAIARHTLRAVAVDDDWSPASALQRLNHVLLAHNAEPADGVTSDPRLVTAAVLGISTAGATVTVTVCCAGHAPPVVVQGGSHVVPVGTPGMALGIIDKPEFTEVVTELAPGDVAAVFTDGLTERRFGKHYFEDRRLGDVLRAGAAAGDGAQALTDRLVAESASFGGSSPRDDVAVLALRALPRLGEGDTPPSARRRSRSC